MTKEESFVTELIGYIFAYPDDDYMTMECLCRKLHKYGLIEKKDGEWTTDFIDHKTENSSEKPNNCEVKNYCDDCLYTDICDSKEFFYACTSKATISKMEQVDEDINVRSKDEPTTQTETQNSNLTFEKRTMRDCYNCKKFETEGECIECHYEPKDEPTGYNLTPVEDEPQTDCAWK